MIIKKHGVPERILTNVGKEFENNFCKDFAARHGISWEFSSPRHHHTVGEVERLNQTLWSKLRTISDFGRRSWMKFVKAATFAVNIFPHKALGTSPYFLRWGKTPVLPGDERYSLDSKRFDRWTLEERRKRIRINYDKEIKSGMMDIPMDSRQSESVLVFKPSLCNKLKEQWYKEF